LINTPLAKQDLFKTVEKIITPTYVVPSFPNAPLLTDILAGISPPPFTKPGLCMRACCMPFLAAVIGRAHTTGENGKWGKTKQRSENQVAFNINCSGALLTT
jgi:hypothetical protein